MQLNWLDWCFIGGYCLASLIIGLIFTHRASKNIDEYFIGGRTMTWWLAGTSIVATTFASDTPLVVAGFVRSEGIYANWFWWNALLGGMMTVFFYARLWRRAGIVTDVEFIELRYEGRPAAVLRGFMAVYGGILQNCITMGWVMVAMMKICDVMLGWDKLTSMVVMMSLLVFYTTLSGYLGVVWTDFFQFGIAMFGCILLAGFVVVNMGGFASMVATVAAAPGVDAKVFDFTPDFATATKLALITFIVQMSIQWWGGAQGHGYIAQRFFSCSTERESALAALWFNFAHYVLRPWPWIIVGLASLVYFPLTPGEDPERAFPLMVAKFLPMGFRGLMVASLMAAFMSTMETQLNWGASYLVNDLYKRFLRPDAPTKHYVFVSRLCVLLLTALGALTAWQFDSIRSAWIYLAMLTAGAGLVGMLRWYWWRVNPWSEITALGASFVIANGQVWAIPFKRMGMLSAETIEAMDWLYSKDGYAVLFALIVFICTILWVGVTFFTRPASREHLDAFYRRVRPGGWWGPVAQRCPEIRCDSMGSAWAGWLAGVACIYTGLFGIGYLCVGRPELGGLFLCVSAVSGWFTVARANISGDS